jgi:molybdate transport system substrate-binding protein
MFIRWSLKASVFCLLLAVSFLLTKQLQAATAAPIIAVASNMRFVIDELASGFKKESGLNVRFSFGSSGNLARQILQGAPFEMFMSADEGYVFKIHDAGIGIDKGHVYGFGRIVTFIPPQSALLGATFPDDFPPVFSKQTNMRFAVANPDIAPYGRAAKEALIHAQLWKQIQPHLIYGETITQTAQFSISGSTLGGIISYSLALSSPLAGKGNYKLIPAHWHKPIGQRMVLLKKPGDTARQFYQYIRRSKAIEILVRNGYARP